MCEGDDVPLVCPPTRPDASDTGGGEGKGAGSPGASPRVVWSGSGNQNSLPLGRSLVWSGEFLLMGTGASRGRKAMRGNGICSLKDRVLPPPLICMGGPRALSIAAGTVLVKM